MNAPPRRKIVEWILEAWEKLSKDLIIKSFKTSALNLATDGSEDEFIHCFKKEEACPNGADRLKEALQVLLDESPEENPFNKATESDLEDAC